MLYVVLHGLYIAKRNFVILIKIIKMFKHVQGKDITIGSGTLKPKIDSIYEMFYIELIISGHLF